MVERRRSHGSWDARRVIAAGAPCRVSARRRMLFQWSCLVGLVWSQATQAWAEPPQALSARQIALVCLEDARRWANSGEYPIARRLIDRAAQLEVDWLPGETTPASLLQEINAAEYGVAQPPSPPPAGSLPTTLTEPPALPSNPNPQARVKSVKGSRSSLPNSLHRLPAPEDATHSHSANAVQETSWEVSAPASAEDGGTQQQLSNASSELTPPQARVQSTESASQPAWPWVSSPAPAPFAAASGAALAAAPGAALATAPGAALAAAPTPAPGAAPSAATTTAPVPAPAADAWLARPVDIPFLLESTLKLAARILIVLVPVVTVSLVAVVWLAQWLGVRVIPIIRIEVGSGPGESPHRFAKPIEGSLASTTAESAAATAAQRHSPHAVPRPSSTGSSVPASAPNALLESSANDGETRVGSSAQAAAATEEHWLRAAATVENHSPAAGKIGVGKSIVDQIIELNQQIPRRAG